MPEDYQESGVLAFRQGRVLKLSLFADDVDTTTSRCNYKRSVSGVVAVMMLGDTLALSDSSTIITEQTLRGTVYERGRVSCGNNSWSKDCVSK